MVVNVMAQFAHAGYHEPCAREAWQRIVLFFDRYLKG